MFPTPEKHFKTVLQSAYNNKTPLTITRPNGNIVILAEDEWPFNSGNFSSFIKP